MFYLAYGYKHSPFHVCFLKNIFSQLIGSVYLKDLRVILKARKQDNNQCFPDALKFVEKQVSLAFSEVKMRFGTYISYFMCYWHSKDISSDLILQTVPAHEFS